MGIGILPMVSEVAAAAKIKRGTFIGKMPMPLNSSVRS
jgi:hypothetical protein